MQTGECGFDRIPLIQRQEGPMREYAVYRGTIHVDDAF